MDLTKTDGTIKLFM